MRLLDRYLLRELLIPFGYCLGGFLLFWISFDLFSEINDFQKQHLQAMDVASYYVAKTPELLVVVLPVALLLSLLYALTNHARHQELTAIRAAGIGLWRLSMPYLALGFLLSLGLFAINELWVPQSSALADAILEGRNADEAGRQEWERNLFFINQRDRRTWSIGAYDPDAREMLNPHLEWMQTNGDRREIFATQANWTNDQWVFYNVEELVYPPETGAIPFRAQTNQMVLPGLSETPAQIRSEIKISRLENFRAAKKAVLSISEILDYEKLHPDDPAKRAMLRTQLQGRLAAPWTCLVVVLISIPFGAASGRRNVFVGVAASIFICFAYFILMRLGLAMGTGGYLPSWLAAWAPNLVFGGAGVLLTHRVR